MDKTLEELNIKVSKFIKPKSTIRSNSQNKNIINSTLLIYIIAPIIISFILIFFKPSLIMSSENNEGIVNSKINYKKMLCVIIIISVIINLCIYKYKM